MFVNTEQRQDQLMKLRILELSPHGALDSPPAEDVPLSPEEVPSVVRDVDEDSSHAPANLPNLRCIKDPKQAKAFDIRPVTRDLFHSILLHVEFMNYSVYNTESSLAYPFADVVNIFDSFDF